MAYRLSVGALPFLFLVMILIRFLCVARSAFFRCEILRKRAAGTDQPGAQCYRLRPTRRVVLWFLRIHAAQGTVTDPTGCQPEFPVLLLRATR
jgi:hypothetical protein